MNAQELLKSGKPGEALASLQQEVRGNAADPKLRVFLFQLLCVLGQWDRALTQLAVLADMGSEEQMLSRIFEPVVRCESLRAQIFAGGRSPILFGEPESWMSLLIQANSLVANGDFKGAASLRDRAMEEAPAVSGQVDGSAFEWIMDADPRLGPMMEAIIEGTYYWVPFMRVKRVIIEAPTDLRDLVWAPAHFLWVNGGEVFGHVPVRYPGSEKHADGPIQLARKTEWVEQPSGYSLGLGHRLLSTDTTDLPLLECRTIEMNLESPALDPSAAEPSSNPTSHG
ncbi:MAG: tetratricopeptide repeat protein [Verrucomicrobia bacterium]|jgi:type VI secretion system protein ImpE|nr:tetratricopeptide repeat protein [Verrucomicrobiota bacterium]